MAKLKITPGGYPLLPKALNRLLKPFRGLRRLRFDADELMDLACSATGLDDFGPDDFVEPLELMLADFRAHPPTALGRLMIVSALTQALANRLRVLDAHRRLRYQPVRTPIVIVGWNRTGTTFLHNLLDGLPGFGYIPLYRLIQPLGRPGDRLRARATLKFTGSVAPELPKLHPHTATGPQEDWMLMFASFRVDGVTMHWNIPSYTEFVTNCDMTPAYDYFVKTLSVVRAQRGHEFILKDPAHLVGLPELVEAIPEARLVWTHRDPVTAVSSLASLSVVQHRSIYEAYDPVRAGRATTERMIHCLLRGTRSRDRLPDGSLFDLPYPEMMADPVAAVEKICRYFDMPFGDRARRAVEKRLAYMKANKPPKHVYDASQYGIDPGEVYERLEEYDPALYS